MRIYDHEPSDAELAEFLNPSKAPHMGLRIEDTPENLFVHPRKIPLWFVAVCGLVPLLIFVGVMVHEAQGGILPAHMYLGLFLGCMALLTALVGGHFVNKYICKDGVFLVLDKLRGNLVLPRLGLEFQPSQIQSFAEVHGWHVERDAHGRSSAWMAELTIFVPTEDGKIGQYSVCAGDSWTVAKVAIRLAEFFKVTNRLLKLDRKTRRRLKANRQASGGG